MLYYNIFFFTKDGTIVGSSPSQKEHSTTSKTSKTSYATSKFGLSDIYEKTEYDSSHSKSGDKRSRKVSSEETDARTTPSYESPEKFSSLRHSSRDQHPKSSGEATKDSKGMIRFKTQVNSIKIIK